MTTNPPAPSQPDPEGAGAPTPQALIPEADKSGPKPAFDSEQYNKVARSAQLRGISLIKAKFVILPEFFLARSRASQAKINYQAQIKSPNFDPARGTASCEWHWGINSKSRRKITLAADAVYLLTYSGLNECEIEAVTTYMRRVGRFTTYPYFRARISQLSWESGAEIPVLPSIAT